MYYNKDRKRIIYSITEELSKRCTLSVIENREYVLPVILFQEV